MNSKRLQQIKKKLEELTQKDTGHQIFGAGEAWGGHQYHLNPPIAEADVAEFETAHGLRLPPEYRMFLTEIGDGKAGPFYGLYSLEDGLREAVAYSNEDGRPVENSFAADFPLSNADVRKFIKYYDKCMAEGEDDSIQYPEIPDLLTGVIFLAQYGCGWSYCLVVKGEQAGTVWFHGDYLSPVFSNGKQWTFFDWYENWLDRSLAELDPAPVEEVPALNPASTIVNYDGWQLTEIPEEVFSCKNLKKLVFSRNDLKEFPKRITELTELKTLDLSMTPIVKIPDEIGELKQLKELFLNYNYHPDLPKGLVQLQHLAELRMFYNYKLKAIPAVVTELANLKKLEFSRCPKLKKIPADIGKLKKLESLNVEHCDQLSELPKSLVELKKLKYLYLSGTGIKKLPDGFEKLQNLESLSISLDGLDWADTIEKLKQLPKLTWLTIALELDYPAALSELTNITSLTIEQNWPLWHRGHQKVPVPANICLIPNLEALSLMNNNQARALPDNIGDMKNLKHLEVSSTAIKGFPDSLQKLTQLELIEGGLDKSDGEYDYGILPAEKAKLEGWLPDAKIRIW